MKLWQRLKCKGALMKL